MKKVIASVLSVAMVAALAAGCTSNPTESTAATGGDTEATESEGGETSGDETEESSEGEETTTKKEMTFGTGAEVITLMSFTDEVPKMVGQYVSQKPEFGEKYTVKCTIIATDGGAYQTALDAALVAGGDTAPDLYTAEAAFVLKYTQGDMAKFAATYKDLGIDVSQIESAGIAPYSVEIGTRDNEVVALGYQASGCAMIYRSSIAQAVFGTDDPAEIEKICGAGTGTWDKYWEAAAKLKDAGYVAVSGGGDIWNACEKSADTAWIVDGQLNIDPKREAYIDIAKQLKDNGWSNDTTAWQEGWFADMKKDSKVFAFFGPAWLINYTIGQHCGEGDASTAGDWRVTVPPVGFYWGGTWVLASKYAAQASDEKKAAIAEFISWITLDTSDTGLQYLWANGLMNENGTKDTVASSVVMAKSNGELEFLGGQNMFDYFVPANDAATGKLLTQSDEAINTIFRDQVRQYTAGEKTKDQAISDFKAQVSQDLGIES